MKLLQGYALIYLKAGYKINIKLIYTDHHNFWQLFIFNIKNNLFNLRTLYLHIIIINAVLFFWTKYDAVLMYRNKKILHLYFKSKIGFVTIFGN